MIKNLITGPGFVASHLADLLLEKGEKVYVTYRWTDNQDSFAHIKDKVNWVLMDLNDLSSCLKVIENVKPDYIFHLGAQSYVPASFDYPAETLRTNVIGTYNLLEAVRIVREVNLDIIEVDINQHPVKNCIGVCTKSPAFDPIIHVCSSSEVYGLVTKDEVPIKETCKFNPANPYAVSKVGEDMVALMYYTNYGLKVIRTRFFTHTGPRRTMLSAEVAFAKQIAEFEKENREDAIEHACVNTKAKFILKHGNLNSIRTFADVRDAVKGYYILSKKGVPEEVYNIGGDHTCSIGEMLDYLISLSPIKDMIIKQEDKSLIPDTSKFKALGWKPEIPFEKTMKDLLNWWRQNV